MAGVRDSRDPVHGSRLGFYLSAPRTGLRGPENPSDLFPGGPAPGARPHRTLLQYRESTATRTVAGLCPGRIRHPGHAAVGSAGLHPGLRALCAPGVSPDASQCHGYTATRPVERPWFSPPAPGVPGTVGCVITDGREAPSRAAGWTPIPVLALY